MNKAAKITLWLDKYATEKEHFESLKEVISLNCSFNIVGINYSQRIGQLIADNMDLISDCSFENLDENKIVYFEGHSYKVKSRFQIFRLEFIVKNENDDMKVLKLGQFKTEEELKLPFENF